MFQQINPLTNQVFDLVLDFNLLHFVRLYSLYGVHTWKSTLSAQRNSNKIASFSKHKANIFTISNKETDFESFLFPCSLQTEHFNTMSSSQIFGNLFADFRFPRKYGHFIRFILQAHKMQHSLSPPFRSRYVANFLYSIVVLNVYLQVFALISFPLASFFILLEQILIQIKNIDETHFQRVKNAVSL